MRVFVAWPPVNLVKSCPDAIASFSISIGINAAFKSICFNLTLDDFNFGLLLPDPYLRDRSLSLSLSLSRSLSRSRSRSRSLSFSRSLVPDIDDDVNDDDDELLTRSIDEELFAKLRLLFEFGEIAADFNADILGLPELLPVPVLKCFGDDVPYCVLLFGLGKL